MAQTFTLDSPPDVLRFTLSATPDVATQVVLPPGTRKVTINFEEVQGKFAWTGTDNAAVNANYMKLPANQPYEQKSGNRRSIYVAAGTASASVSVAVEGA